MKDSPISASSAKRKALILTLSAVGLLSLLAFIGKVHSVVLALKNDVSYAQSAADESHQIAAAAQVSAEEAQQTADEALSKAEETEERIRYR